MVKNTEENKNLPYSRLALASLVLGLVGLLPGPITTLPAFITGILV